MDDDILIPGGLFSIIAPLLRGNPAFGMLGAWTFMTGDWNEKLARPKIMELDGIRIFRTLRLGGTAFLVRREYALRYLKNKPHHYGLPLDQILMAENGLINGYPLPLLLAHHMDDPRSPHYLNDLGEHASITFRRKLFKSSAAYARWIADDARRMISEPLDAQIKRYRLHRDRSVRSRLKRLLAKIIRPR